MFRMGAALEAARLLTDTKHKKKAQKTANGPLQALAT